MKYVIVENGIVENIIVADPEEAIKFGAVEYYKGCRMGMPYRPPFHETSELELAQQAITDLDLELIQMGQEMTDMELTMYELVKNTGGHSK